MGSRLNGLEETVGILMTQAGIDPKEVSEETEKILKQQQQQNNN